MNKSHLYKPAKYLAAGAFMLFGRYVITRLLSGQRGKELYWKPTPKQQYFTCPSGNVWYAEFDGPADAPPLCLYMVLTPTMYSGTISARISIKATDLYF
jgi:hypothetical protein